MSGWGICPSSYQPSFSNWGIRSPGTWRARLSEQEFELKIGGVGMRCHVLLYGDNEH